MCWTGAHIADADADDCYNITHDDCLWHRCNCFRWEKPKLRPRGSEKGGKASLKISTGNSVIMSIGEIVISIVIIVISIVISILLQTCLKILSFTGQTVPSCHQQCHHNCNYHHHGHPNQFHHYNDHHHSDWCTARKSSGRKAKLHWKQNWPMHLRWWQLQWGIWWPFFLSKSLDCVPTRLPLVKLKEWLLGVHVAHGFIKSFWQSQQKIFPELISQQGVLIVCMQQVYEEPNYSLANQTLFSWSWCNLDQGEWDEYLQLKLFSIIVFILISELKWKYSGAAKSRSWTFEPAEQSWWAKYNLQHKPCIRKWFHVILSDDAFLLSGELDAANCALASQLAEWRHRQEAGQVDHIENDEYDGDDDDDDEHQDAGLKNSSYWSQ